MSTEIVYTDETGASYTRNAIDNLLKLIVTEMREHYGEDKTNWDTFQSSSDENTIHVAYNLGYLQLP